MMDANNIQVNIFYIYNPRKAFEREGRKCATGTQHYLMQFTQRKMFN